jgi:3-deoxy-D-manno-octulosonic-acid transferase
VNRLLRLAYRGVARLAQGAALVAPRGDSKFLRALRARRGIRRRYEQWGSRQRDTTRALVWMHAPSVGEGLQARPVLERLGALHPELQLAYTFFSPSAERFASTLPVEFHDYLPFDSRGAARMALRSLRPSVLAFSKLDIWPVLARESARRGVRLALLSGTLSPRSRRRSRVAAALLRDAYASLDLVGAIDQGDAERLLALGVHERALRITGDTRFDQVWARTSAVDLASSLLAPFNDGRPTLVAGSTWPSDEEPLLIAWREVRGVFPTARLILAPHEPTPEHLAAVESAARRARMPLARLGAPDAAAAEIVLVDRVGVLGDLYALAHVAYVGGGFHGAGLHSVLEPAAYGVPVLFGPRYDQSRDAKLLLARRAAASGKSAVELTDHLIGWLNGSERAVEAGRRAREVVSAGLGAADRSVALIEELLGRTR